MPILNLGMEMVALYGIPHILGKGDRDSGTHQTDTHRKELLTPGHFYIYCFQCS